MFPPDSYRLVEGLEKCLGDFAFVEAIMSLAVYLQRLNVGMVPDQTIRMTIGATIHITNEWKCFRTPRLFRVSVLLRRISISLKVLFLCYCSDCLWRWAKCKPQCRKKKKKSHNVEDEVLICVSSVLWYFFKFVTIMIHCCWWTLLRSFNLYYYWILNWRA